MIKVSLNEIVSSVDSLRALQEVKFPVKISYRIMRLVNKLDPILKSYNEKRDALIKELGEKNEEGNFQVKDPEKLKLFAEKLSELLTTEEEIDFVKINVEDLGEVSVEPKLLVNFIFE